MTAPAAGRARLLVSVAGWLARWRGDLVFALVVLVATVAAGVVVMTMVSR
ncbi:MAG: hypothetical protein ACRDOK_21040 [Streptosporangiaceae bacterium]